MYQDAEISQLLWNLMSNNRQCDSDTKGGGSHERSSNDYAIDEIVERVAN